MQAGGVAIEILCFLALISCQVLLSFNLDTNDMMLFKSGKHGYYFGYSVALHKYKEKRWLIVGAPMGNDTSQGYKARFGGVYKCDLKARNQACDIMTNFDSVDKDAEYTTFKTGQWLGATVKTVQNYIMACAPRFAWSGTGDGKQFYPIGKCEVIDSESEARKWVWMPCGRVPDKSEKSFGYCQFGLDASFSTVEKSAIAGAPLLQKSHGRLIGSNLFSSQRYFSTIVGQPKPSEYLGYSVIFGRLASNRKEVIIAGAPNGDDQKGKVIIFKFIKSLPISTTLRNPTKQIGSYFGASLVTADVNGDGYEDLIVGAPMFSFTTEEGAVFIFINNKRDSLDYLPITLHGDSHVKARFGTSIASAKDLNNDGFEDIIIGAPYGGEDGTGAVYVYDGSRNGIQRAFSQKIVPSQLGLRGLSLRSFGASLAAGVDIDDNGYPDLAVGSFLSDHAVFIRSKPVVAINAVIILQRTQINPELDSHFCLGPDGKRYLCLGTQICFNAGGKNVSMPIDVQYEFVLDDMEPIHKRGVFFENGFPSYRLIKELRIWSNACINHTAYLSRKPRNVYSGIVFKVLYEYRPPKTCHLCPTMKPGSAESKASYTKNCGDDLVCDSDLGVTTRIHLLGGTNSVHVGVTKMLSMEILLKNDKENAFLSTVTVFYQIHLLVVGVHLKKGMNVNWKVDKHNSTHNALVFDAGNPIGPSIEEDYDIKFAVDDIPFDVKELCFKVKARTNSRDSNWSNNMDYVCVATLIVADMTVSGVAIPDQLTYNASKENKGSVGPYILHKFLVQNKGPSTVENSWVNVYFPETMKGASLLNLIAVTVEGPVSCKINESTYNPTQHMLQQSRDGRNSLRRRKRSSGDRLDCATSTCQLLNCEIGRLKRGQNVGIFINSSLTKSTFAKNIKKDTLIVVRAVVVSHAIKQPTLHFPDESEVIVHVRYPKVSSKEKNVPWWIILISVIAGLCLIAGVVFVLYKSGFFNRKKRDYSFAPVTED